MIAYEDDVQTLKAALMLNVRLMSDPSLSFLADYFSGGYLRARTALLCAEGIYM